MPTATSTEDATECCCRIISGLQVVWHQVSLREGFGPHATDWKHHYVTCLRLLQHLKNGTAFQHKNFAPKCFHCSDVRDIAFWNGCILAGEISKLKCLLLHVEYKIKVTPVITGAIGTISQYLKIIQKIPERHTGKAQNKGATENSHIGHCTHTLESTNKKTQNVQHGK